MAQDWYYALDGRREGPVDTPRLRDLIARGHLADDTLVWTEGMADWAPLHASPALRAAGPLAAPAGPFAGPAVATTGGPGRPMGFAEAVASVFRNYATFKGRASRSEFWFFQLFLALAWMGVFLVLAVAPKSALAGILLLLLSFGVILPVIAVTVRRLHDSDKSGWWLLLYFVPLGGLVVFIFTLLAPTPGPNSYG